MPIYSRLPVAISMTALLLMCLLHAELLIAQQDLEPLRAEYQQALKDAAQLPRPAAGDPDFRNKLAAWSASSRRRTEAIHRLSAALLKAWSAATDSSPELANLQEELKSLYDEARKPIGSEKSRMESKFFAGMIWQYLTSTKTTEPRAAFLVSLSVPHRTVRMNDRLAGQGFPTEPSGWDVQLTYAIALLRAGKLDEAITESDLLLAKLNNNLARGRLPNLTINFRDSKRTQPSLRREFLLYRTLIAANAGNVKAARSFLSQADQIDETDEVLATQKSLLREIDEALRSS